MYDFYVITNTIYKVMQLSSLVEQIAIFLYRKLIYNTIILFY